jgi:uncharacterized protein YdbL (DUF1318 family)
MLPIKADGVFATGLPMDRRKPKPTSSVIALSICEEIDMQLENIKAAKNGFILEDCYGNLHIAKTLVEAAKIVGEIVPDSNSSNYVAGCNERSLRDVRTLAVEGRKIEAIKILRNCFTARLGLREAKDIVEQLCG